jgi:hypothetical protein
MSPRAWTLTVATSALAVLAIATVIFHSHPLVVALPVGLGLWLLLLLNSGYLLGRAYRHNRRRQASRDERSDRQPDAATRKPLDYRGVLEATPQLRRAIGDPVDYQGRLRAKGVVLALIPLLAVIMLSVQTIFLPKGGVAAVGFAAAECAVLLVMLTIVWLYQQPTQAWVTSRFRMELFRREMYLLVAQTGPYLAVDESDVERIRDARVNVLTQADVHQLQQLIDLSDQDTRSVEYRWIDAVWQAGPKAADPGTVERMRTYLEYRIGRQILFFNLGMGSLERTEKNLDTTAKIAMLSGIAVAIVYVTLLATSHRLDQQSSIVTATLALLAVGIAPLCNGVLAIQNLFASQRLATSYVETRNELLRHENTLRELISRASEPDAGTRFHALAIHVETTLSQELLRWKMLVDRPEFEPAM